MAYYFCALKTYAFIFNFILFYYIVNCWPRYKRSNDDVSPILTASLYDRLKERLAPVLQETIDLSTIDENPKKIQKRFIKVENKVNSVDLNKIGGDSEKALGQSQGKRSLLISKVYPGSVKYDINTMLIPHKGNQSTLAVSDQENDYDYSDRDLPDIEEPPAHIFEYNRANSSSKKVVTSAVNPSPSSSYPQDFIEDISKQKIEKYCNNYEKCKQHLAPLGTKNSHLENPSKLQEKFLKPYAKLISNDKDQDEKATSQNNIINIDSAGNLAYNSLYDQFKTRLMDFSTELGIDAGLSGDNILADVILSQKLKAVPSGNKKKLKGTKDLGMAVKKAQQLWDNLNKDASLSLNNRRNEAIDETEQSKQKHFNSNNFKRNSDIQINGSSSENKIGQDVDFLLQQRGHPNKNHKDNAPEKLGVDIDDNEKKKDPYVNGYVDGGCDYNEVLKPMTILKTARRPNEANNRLFRKLDDKEHNFMPDVISENNALDQSQFFPNILVEPISTPLDSTSKLSSGGLIENVADKLRMSTLDVAKNIAAIQDLSLTAMKDEHELHNTLQQYIEDSVIGAANKAQVDFPFSKTQELNKNLLSEEHHPVNIASSAESETSSSSPFAECVVVSNGIKNDCPWEQTKTRPKPNLVEIPAKKEKPRLTSAKAALTEDQVKSILEKLLGKLQEIEFDKIEIDANDMVPLPLEDAPCKLKGSWFSATMGLRFDLSLSNMTERFAQPEAQRLRLDVGVQECVPPRPHDIIDTKWPFIGSAIKETGGPFYLYTQKKSENILATFVGFCRTCGNMDTIFGTWSFSLPAKSCQDTPASFQTKNDVMHRYALEEKRRARYKEMLHNQSNHSA